VPLRLESQKRYRCRSRVTQSAFKLSFSIVGPKWEPISLFEVNDEFNANIIIMGLCESCQKAQPDEEATPLLTSKATEAPAQTASALTTEEDTKDWHQSLIDNANAQFISSNYRHRQRTVGTPEEIRYVFVSLFFILHHLVLDCFTRHCIQNNPLKRMVFISNLVSLHDLLYFDFKYIYLIRNKLCNVSVPSTSLSISSGIRLLKCSEIGTGNLVVDVLSESVVVSDKLESDSEQIAEIVSSHIRSDRHKLGHESNAVVAHLKPSLPTGSN
jgi:hypothetical protein